MSEWFDSYMKRLAEVSSAGARPGDSGVDITARIMQAGRGSFNPPPAAPTKPGRGWLNTGFNPTAGDAGGLFGAISNPLNLLNGGWRAGAAALDLAARGNYATANVFTQANKKGLATSFDPNLNRSGGRASGRTSIGDDFDAFMQGLLGREKNTFGDALRESGMEKGWKRAALGFGLDVALDPINLIPGSVFAKGVGGAKALAKKTPGFKIDPDEGVKTIEELRRTEPWIPDTVSIKPSGDPVDMPAPVGKPVGGMPAPAAANAGSDLFSMGSDAEAPGARILAELFDSDANPRAAIPGQQELFDLDTFHVQSLLETVDQGLRAVPTPRNAPASLFRDDVLLRTEPVMEEVPKFKETVTGGVDPDEFIASELMSRYLRDPYTVKDGKRIDRVLPIPEGYQGLSKKTSKGTTVATHRAIGEWVAGATTKKEKAARRAAYEQTIRRAAGFQAAAKKGKFGPDHIITAKDQAGRTHKIPFSRVMEYVKDDLPIEGESARWVMPSYGMKPGSDGITYGEFVQFLRERVGQLPAKTTEKVQVGTKLKQVGQKEIYGRKVIENVVDRQAWRDGMIRAGFTENEVRALMRNANLGEKQYDNALQRMLATPFQKSYSLEEFIDGVRAGTIDDTVPEIQRMYRTLFGEKVPKTPKGRINAFEKKVAALRNKINKNGTLADKAAGVQFDKDGQGFLDVLVPGPTKASKISKGKDAEIVKGVSDPESPWIEAKLDAANNPTAEEIVTEAATVHGDESVAAALNAPKVEINEVQATAVAEALKTFGERQFRQLDIWRHKTNRGAGRTSATPGEGYARWPSVNAYGQFTLERLIYKNLEAKGAFQNVDFADRIDVVMPALKAAEQALIAKGMAPTLGHGATGIPLSFHDILTAMGREWSVENYFNVTQALPHTHISEGVELVLDSLGKGADAQVTWNALRTIAKKSLPGKIKYGPDGTPLKGKGGKVLRGAPRPNYFYNAHKGRNWNKVVDEKFVKPIIANAAELHRVAESNRAALNLASGKATKEIAETVIEKFVQDSSNGQIAGMLARMANMRKEITATTKAHPLGTIEGIAKAASDEVTAELGQMGASVSSAAKAAEVIDDARLVRNYRAMKAATTKRGADIDSEMEGILAVQRLTSPPGGYPNGPVVVAEHTDLWDIGQDVGAWMEANVARRIAPHAGNQHIRPLLVGQRQFAIANSARYTRSLSELTKKYPTPEINSAFNLIKSGGAESSSAPVVSDLKRLMDQIFDVDNPKYDALHRNGMMLHELNRAFDHYGVPGNLRFKEDFTEWQKWDIPDPLDFLSKAHTAMQSTAAHQALGDAFVKKFGSTAKKPGYVKMVNESGKDSILWNYLDTDNYYFPKEIAREFTVMDEALRQMNKPANRSKLLRMYDTAFYSLKAGYTIYRVGHHMRNALGDAWFSYMDGVTDPRYYTDAWRLLAVGRGRYPDFDFNQALQGVGHMPTDDAAMRTIATVPFRGKKIKLSAAKMYQMMYQKGALPDHSIIEDVRFDTLIGGVSGDVASSSGPAGRLRKPFGGKVRQGAVKVSEVRDHYFRAAHFIKEMEKTKLPKGFKGDEDAALDWIAEQAAIKVRKFHPDGGDLTAFEHQVARRTVTFYSWARKAIPLVVELMFLKPGRFMQFPKAMMNIAEGMGVDLESYGDPFPQDQLFPSFLRDSVQGVAFGESGNTGSGYWGLKTGHPGMDIIDDFLYSPKNLANTLPGLVTPFARVPAELMTGHKVTGAPIMDYSDYFGQNLPNVGYADKVAANLTGRTLSSGFTDEPYTAKSNEGYDPGIERVGLINWLLGMGLTDMSKPSYIKTAEREIPEGRGR